MNAAFHEYKGGKIKIDLPVLRDVMNVGGAYGVIHKGRRYMLVSTSYRYNLVVIGHELGHHVCGHFEKTGTSRELELEADRFAGSFARAVHDHAYGDDGWFEEMRNRAERKEVFETAQKVYGPMLPSETHPPAKERIAAFEAGYERGSDCIGRKVLDVGCDRNRVEAARRGRKYLMITTSDEARSLYISKMGEHLGAQFHALWEEVALLHLRWAEFVELFGTKRSRIDLLNQAAPSFFRIVQDVLWDVTLLHIARLTDSSKSFGKADKENLTIQNLPRLVDSRIELRVTALVATAISKATFCRDWRNRNIAHSDLKLALNESPTPLPDVDKQKTEEALSAIEAVLSEVHERYMDSATTFKFVFNDGGAYALLRVIDDGLKHSGERLRRGIWSEDDMPQVL